MAELKAIVKMEEMTIKATKEKIELIQKQASKEMLRAIGKAKL